MKQASQAAAIARVFSAGVFREFARLGVSPMFARILKEADLAGLANDTSTVAEMFDALFRILRKADARNEYIYKAALVNNVLLGTHSLATASMLREFRIDKSKADIVILNGTATVYEIKSERDTLVRLAAQIENYRKVFPKVYVISAMQHVDGIAEIVPDAVGIMSLSRWNRIKTVRVALENFETLEYSVMLDSLRIGEAKQVIQGFGGKVPNVPNTRMRAEILEIFSSYSCFELHSEIVRVLKRSRSQSSLVDLVERLPMSLQAAALSYELRVGDRKGLIDAINQPSTNIFEWA